MLAMLLPILVEGTMRNISVKLFLNLNYWLRRWHLKTFLIYNSRGPLCDGVALCAMERPFV